MNNGESIFQSFLESLDDSLFEVKKDFYRNGRMMVTKAKWWIYLFSDDAFVAVEVDRLKKYINNNSSLKKMTFAAQSTNPTKGFLLMPEDVSSLISSEQYDKDK